MVTVMSLLSRASAFSKTPIATSLKTSSPAWHSSHHLIASAHRLVQLRAGFGDVFDGIVGNVASSWRRRILLHNGVVLRTERRSSKHLCQHLRGRNRARRVGPDLLHVLSPVPLDRSDSPRTRREVRVKPGMDCDGIRDAGSASQIPHIRGGSADLSISLHSMKKFGPSTRGAHAASDQGVGSVVDQAHPAGRALLRAAAYHEQLRTSCATRREHLTPMPSSPSSARTLPQRRLSQTPRLHFTLRKRQGPSGCA